MEKNNSIPTETSTRVLKVSHGKLGCCIAWLWPATTVCSTAEILPILTLGDAGDSALSPGISHPAAAADLSLSQRTVSAFFELTPFLQKQQTDCFRKTFLLPLLLGFLFVLYQGLSFYDQR